MADDLSPRGEPDEAYRALAWDDGGLLPVVAQQDGTGEVLMVAWADRAALAQTLRTGLATYFSRSRGALWVKGETSGNEQRVREVRTDCDGDVLLYVVDSPGPACHTGRRSCFFHVVAGDGAVRRDDAG